MEEHKPACDCGHDHNHESHPKVFVRWLFSLFFISASFFLIRPFLAKQLQYRASAYLSSELYDEAIRQYKKVVFIDKSNNDAWDWMGYAYECKKNYGRAIDAYKEAVKINPRNKTANFSLGMIYMQQGNIDAAVLYFKIIVAMGQKDESQGAVYMISYYRSALSMLAECYKRLNKKKELGIVLQKMSKLYPEGKSTKSTQVGR